MAFVTDGLQSFTPPCTHMPLPCNSAVPPTSWADMRWSLILDSSMWFVWPVGCLQMWTWNWPAHQCLPSAITVKRPCLDCDFQKEGEWEAPGAELPQLQTHVWDQIRSAEPRRAWLNSADTWEINVYLYMPLEFCHCYAAILWPQLTDYFSRI